MPDIKYRVRISMQKIPRAICRPFREERLHTQRVQSSGFYKKREETIVGFRSKF